MSVGNATQAIDFDRNDLTLVLGENMDLGGDDGGARNGTGKTTIINALSYSLFGQALTNIKKDNLINKTNSKNMLVTIEFECNGRQYRIERGRKPNVLKFFIDDDERAAKDDNSQGDSRETQQEIERLLNMSHDMFKHIVALNTYTEPFLSLRANDQRTIIEQLLGITMLSEKAEALKEQIRTTKELITQEEYRIKAVQDANVRIQDQIDSLVRRQTLWLQKKNQDLESLRGAYDQLSHLDIDAELAAHQQLTVYQEQLHKHQDWQSKLDRLKRDLSKEEKIWAKLDTEVQTLKEHRCYACGQEFHDEQHTQVLEDKMRFLEESRKNTDNLHSEIAQLEANPVFVTSKPSTFYENASDAFEHRSSVDSILRQIETKEQETDPYAEQIKDMQERGIEAVDYDQINALTKVKDHQEFLQKLLTNKDSFIRKKIIDQNLSYLNGRLSHYLDRIGLPHTVKFLNDLSVSIEELGRELDFDNLSRGERNRLILSLSWAFRDVWESLYQPINLLFIDELIDSGLDTVGVENALAILKHMSRDGSKSVWLVSHRDELVGRVSNTMKVIKENGFTTYNTDIEIE